VLILSRQVRELQIATSQPLGYLVFQIISSLASLGIAFFFSWKLTLVIIAVFPIAAVILYLISMGLGPAIEAQKRELDKASKYSNTAIVAIDTVKVFNGQDHEVWQYLTTITKVATQYLKQARINALQFGITRFVLVITFVIGFWFGLFLVHRGLSPGNVLTTFYSCLSAIQALEIVLPQWLVLTKGMSAAHTLRAIIDEIQQNGEKMDMDGSLKPKTCDGDIELNNASCRQLDTEPS
jgi:ATP-binding cassette subfamily B (MDR/TAP) protein 1